MVMGYQKLFKERTNFGFQFSGGSLSFNELIVEINWQYTIDDI